MVNETIYIDKTSLEDLIKFQSVDFEVIDGYYFNEVKASSIKNEDLNSIILNIDIDLGEKAKIKKISFIGNKIFKDKKLIEILASEEHKFWKFISNKVYLNQSIIDLDVRLLENYYRKWKTRRKLTGNDGGGKRETNRTFSIL